MPLHSPKQFYPTRNSALPRWSVKICENLDPRRIFPQVLTLTLFFTTFEGPLSNRRNLWWTGVSDDRIEQDRFAWR